MVTTSYEVHKRTENIITSEEVVKGTDSFHELTFNITTNEDVDKSTENFGRYETVSGHNT